MTGPGVTFWRVRAAQATSRNRAQGVPVLRQDVHLEGQRPLVWTRAAVNRRQLSTALPQGQARTQPPSPGDLPQIVRASRHAGMPKAFHKYEPPQS